MTEPHHRSSFFRQSSWMMIATVSSGVLNSFVHGFSKVLPNAEYTAFGTLLQVLAWMTLPVLGLQTIFAQQTSAIVTESGKRQLVGTTRAVLRGTFYIWLIMLLIAFVTRHRLIAALGVRNPAALWITLLTGLAMLWLPIFQGLLQGRHNFLWLGWSAIFNSLGRLLVGSLIVFVLGGWAAGVMTSVLIGMAAALGVAMWHNRDLWGAPRDPFHWKDWLARLIPLTFGAAVSQFLFSADLFVVQANLGQEGRAAPYVFGGTLARGIVLFTSPLVAVMFPKLVHSAVRLEKTNLMWLTFAGTALLSSMAALGLTIVAPTLIRIGSKPENLSIVPLIPLFAWSMVPLAMGNVLLNNLLALSRFKCVPFLMVLIGGYWVALQYHHDSFKSVIQTLGIFNLIFLAVCAVFTWKEGKRKASH